MGFSVSGSAAVILVGLLVSAATLYPAVDSYVERRSGAVDADRERALTQQNTAVEAVDATHDTSTDRLLVAVKNTGPSTLAVSDTDLLVDGEYQRLSGSDTAVDGDTTTDIWASGETLNVTVTRSSSPARVKLVTGPGVAVTAPVEVV